MSLSALKDLGYAAKTLATSETLDAHAFSASLRISEKMGKQKDEYNKIISVDLDDSNLPLPSHEALQERKVAIFDLLTENFFRPIIPENYPK